MNSLIPAVLPSIGPIVLCSLLLCATWSDCKTFRIPNRLVAFGIAAGLLVNMVSPAVEGLSGSAPNVFGLWSALQGMCVGFAILLPFYFMRALGAGDVKLMAMIGAFLGPAALVCIIFTTFLCGGTLSLGLALKRKKFRLLVENLQAMLIAIYLNFVSRKIGQVETPAESVGTLPYAVAITGGTFLYLAVANSVPLNRFIPF